MTSSFQNIGDLAISQMQQGSATNGNLKLRGVASSEELGKKAQDFEGMFISQMLQPMFESIGVNPTFGGGHGEEVMRGFLVQEYGKAIADHGGFGIAAAVKNEMIRAQGTPRAVASPSQGAAYASLQ